MATGAPTYRTTGEPGSFAPWLSIDCDVLKMSPVDQDDEKAGILKELLIAIVSSPNSYELAVPKCEISNKLSTS